MTRTGLPLRWRKIDAGAYKSSGGHYVVRLDDWDPSRITGLPWRMSNRNGDWCDDYRTLAEAKQAARDID